MNPATIQTNMTQILKLMMRQIFKLKSLILNKIQNLNQAHKRKFESG